MMTKEKLEVTIASALEDYANAQANLAAEPCRRAIASHIAARLGRQEMHDLVREALENSLGPDWSCTLGATYVVDALLSLGAPGGSDVIEGEGNRWVLPRQLPLNTIISWRQTLKKGAREWISFEDLHRLAKALANEPAGGETVKYCPYLKGLQPCTKDPKCPHECVTLEDLLNEPGGGETVTVEQRGNASDYDFPAEPGGEEVKRLLDALVSIQVYANDTLSGPAHCEADVAWYRESVTELRNRAGTAIKNHSRGEKHK